MSAQPNVNQAAHDYRAALAARDQAAARRLVRAYHDALDAIDVDLRKLTAKMAEARLAGDEPTLAWLFMQERYIALQQKIQAELDHYAVVAGIEIRHRIGDEAQAGALDATSLVRQSGIPLGPDTWANLPAGAVETIVGTTQGPVGALLSAASRDGAAQARSALIRGVSLGLNPRQTAKAVRQATGVTANRALLISRTETLRAYRLAAAAAWQQNPRVVQAWRWQAALDRRCCPVCWAMDGTVHPLDEVFATHPSCRCTPVPVTATPAELGVAGPDTAPPVPETGAARFARLDPDTQDAILGKAKARAYRGHRIALRDVVRPYDHPVWGPSRGEASLGDALANAQERRAGG